MNDIEKLLEEDIKRKKQACSGYRYKKNGSKSKKCSLPSDNLSKKEIKKMNGECKVYSINKPMAYKEFCAMPVDIQIIYLENLRDKYGASQSDIADMMGCKHTTLTKHRLRILNGKPVFKSYRTSRLDIDAWNRLVNCEEANESIEPEPDEEVEDNSNDTEGLNYNEVVPKADIISGTMDFKGKAGDILRRMMDILGYDNEYEICVCFKSVSK